MVARVSSVLFLISFVFWNVSGYRDMAGSCDSPRSHHHGEGQEGDGGYQLEVRHPHEVYSPGQEVVLMLRKSDNAELFEGFQIICEECEFPFIERSIVAQINDGHCDLSGRISHKNDTGKSRVEVTAKLPQDASQNVEIEYYVVQHRHDWYGPLKLVLPMNNTSLSSSSSSSPSPSTSLSSMPSQCPCPSEFHNVCTSPSSDSSSVESKWSFETCQPSAKGSDLLMAKLSDFFTIYWSLHDIEDKCARVDILVGAKTNGWGSLAFAEKNGRMYPADAALGWIGADGTDCHLEAYRIIGLDVHERDANSSLLEMKCITREDDWLYIGFTKHAQCGVVHVDLTKDIHINYAIAKKNELVEHNKFKSATINFASGEYHVTTYRKDYQAHGSLMIIAWIVLVPFGILTARYRWSPPAIERIGWLDLHRGIIFLVVLCVVVALLVAIITFPPVESKVGRAHALTGILTSIVLGIQVVVAIFRPTLEEPRRPIFNVLHAWTGRGLFVSALIATSLGISAFHKVTGSSIVTWVVWVVVLLLIYIIVVILIETKLRWALYREGGSKYIGMTKIEYDVLDFNNNDE